MPIDEGFQEGKLWAVSYIDWQDCTSNWVAGVSLKVPQRSLQNSDVEDVKVYIDDDGIIFNASLNQTNIGGNNNKFYRLQLLYNDDDQYYAHTRWGRVGEYGQVKTMGPFDLDGARKEFDKKFKDKSGHTWDERSEPVKKGKCKFLEKNYEDDEDEAENQVKDEY